MKVQKGFVFKLPHFKICQRPILCNFTLDQSQQSIKSHVFWCFFSLFLLVFQHSTPLCPRQCWLVLKNYFVDTAGNKGTICLCWSTYWWWWSGGGSDSLSTWYRLFFYLNCIQLPAFLTTAHKPTDWKVHDCWEGCHFSSGEISSVFHSLQQNCKVFLLKVWLHASKGSVMSKHIQRKIITHATLSSLTMTVMA